MANEYDGTADPRDVLLGVDVKTHAPVHVSYADRDVGVAVIGKAGTGKSSLLEHLILADLEHGTPGMVIDPHGLLVQRVMELATPAQARHIILLEVAPDAPFGLNLLAVRKPVDKNDEPIPRAVDSVVATIKKLFGESHQFLPRLERYLRLSARTLIPSQGTLVDVPRLFDDPPFRQACLARVTDPEERESLRRSWANYDKLRPGEQIIQTEALVNRLEALVEPPAIRRIVGSQETTVPFHQVLNGDSMLLVSLPSDRLSPERCNFIGAMLLCTLADQVFARKVSGSKPPRLHIYLDEYQRFATDTTAELLNQGRKYNAGVTMANQSLQQIRDPEIRNASRHAGTLIVLGVTRPDAEELAGEFPVKPKEERLERVEEVDGTEPVTAPSPEPIMHLINHGHSDPQMQEIAESFRQRFRLGINVQRAENDLLVLAMNGRLSKKDMYQRIWDIVCDPSIMRYSTEKGRYSHVSWDYEREELYRKDELMMVYWQELYDEYVAWYNTHFEHRETLAGPPIKIGAIGTIDPQLLFMFTDADERYIDVWRRHGCWGQPFLEWKEPGVPVHYKEKRRYTPEEHESSLRAQLAYQRSRIRFWLMACKGLAKSPLLVTTGEYRPRVQIKLIPHAKQTEQDALNEFAARLVNPGHKYVAHVRIPTGYHETKLRRPPEEEGGGGAPVIDPVQPDDIRDRSRALYATSTRQVTPAPPSRPQGPPITRRSPNAPVPRDNSGLGELAMTVTVRDNRSSRRVEPTGPGQAVSPRGAEQPTHRPANSAEVSNYVAGREPPVSGALVLHKHLVDQAGLFPKLLRDGSAMAGMAGYTWFKEENFTKAHRWCLGMMAALKANLPADFFVNAIVDLYHFDRALRASAHSNEKHEPVRRTDIPKALPGNSQYRLRVKPFSWSPTVPHRAVDTVSDFLQEITPDSLWIAEYEETSVSKYDPIIYATFGPWEVELVRWD